MFLQVPWLVNAILVSRVLLPEKASAGNTVLQSGNLNTRAAKGNRLVILIVDVHHGAPHDSGLGLGVDVGGERETRDVDVILHKVDALNEQRRGLHDAAFGAHHSARAGVKVDASFEQTESLGAGVHLKDVHRATVQGCVGLVRKLVIGGSKRSQRRIVLLHVVDFGLKQTCDDFAFDESVAKGTDHLEPERAGSRVVTAKCVLSVLRGSW